MTFTIISVYINGFLFSFFFSAPFQIFVQVDASQCYTYTGKWSRVNTRVYLFFYNDVHSVNGSRATQGRGLQSKMHILLGYVSAITVDLRLEQVKSVVIREISTCRACMVTLYATPLKYLM